MADHPNPALRDKLIADRDELKAVIRGLPDVAITSISPAARTVMQEELAVRERRRDLINQALNGLGAVVTSLEALEADGWPNKVPQREVSDAIAAELEEERGDVVAAVGVVKRKPQAVTINATLGAPEPKPA